MIDVPTERAEEQMESWVKDFILGSSATSALPTSLEAEFTYKKAVA
jgi:hypothetical protein